jgi:transglutaminase-like putative cysteine protease
MDRSPTSLSTTIWYLLVLVATLAAIAHDERTVGTGRVRTANRSFMRGGTAATPIAIIGLVVAIGLVSTIAITERTPNAGALEWRTTGFGNGLFGGVSFNHFVSIQHSLVNLSNDPVFSAQVQGSIDEETLYWKLIALEEFDGVNWFPLVSPSGRPSQTGTWETADQTFHGPTERIVSTITIDNLRETYLPAPYTPVGMASNYEFVNASFRVRPDGAVKIDARTFEGLEYQVTSDVPQPSLSVLASNQGELSPMFAQAAFDGTFDVRSSDAPVNSSFEDVEELVDTSQLGDEDDAILTDFSRLLTERAETNFERAILLEDYFRDSSIFTYNTQIASGHSAESIVDWLLDPDSTNYHEGYCEQFAASMAIMARTLNIPSRVILGFAPGDVAADGTVTVRENDAHSWVELWFNTQGWVRFDPTPRSANDNPSLSASLGFDPSEISISERLGDLSEDNPGGPGLDPESNTLEDIRQRILEGENAAPEVRIDPALGNVTSSVPLRIALVLAVMVAPAIPPGLRAWRRKRRIDRMRTGDISAAWAEIVDELADLGRPVSVSATPREAAEGVTEVMAPLAAAYEAQIYGRIELSEARIREARASFGLTRRHLQDVTTPQSKLLRWMRIGSLRRH